MRIIFALIAVLLANNNADAACRSAKVKHQFDVLQGYPHGRPSLKGEEKWIVDHVCALTVGGLDIVENMQYQTLTDSKKKDRIENTKKGRELFCNKTNSLPYRTVYNCR